jgi:hypothetical protein
MRKTPLIGTAAAAVVALTLLLNPLTRAGDAAKNAAGAKDAGAKPTDPKSPLGLLSEADKKLPRDNNYIVHEWGTFTSFAGSDGVSLDFRPLVDEDLPKFVMDRPKQAALNQRRDIAYARGYTGKSVLSKQRMETPVTYFYSGQERIVDVTVEFPRGLLTEFFPPVRQFGPAFKPDAPEPLSGSWLRWGNVRLLPKSKEGPLNKDGVDPFLRQVEPGENPHYAYARETDANQIQITDPATMSTAREKFLFYRGVGNFNLPVRVTARGGDHFTFTHSGKTPLHYAFLVQIDDRGGVRFARFDQIGHSIEMTLPSQPSSLDALSDEMVRALVSDGLFDKEAQAMVKTWKSSWFGERGTRVLYSLGQSDTDVLLPLHLSPAPKEIVRVMIGRLETLTPEQESTIEGLVARLGDDDPAIRMQTAARLKELGRFAEPALTRVTATSNDPEVQVKAQALLRGIAAGKGHVATPN